MLDIDTWLMSCRVLKRGVEQFLLNHLVDARPERRRARGDSGRVYPHGQERLVRDHYAKLGFARLGGDESGRTTWDLPPGRGWTPLPTFITESHPDGLDPR